MTRIVVAINIHRPIGAVFDYITTPANWPAWHPASRAVSGSVDHSLLIGAGGKAWKLRMASDATGGALSVDDHDIHAAGPSRNHLPPRVAGRKHSLRAEVHLCNVRHLALYS